MRMRMLMWYTDADADAEKQQQQQQQRVKYVDFSKNYDSVTPARPIKVSGERGRKRVRERERQTDRLSGS